MPGDAKPAAPRPAVAIVAEEAVCVCNGAGDNIVAWFAHRPAAYGAIGAAVSVHTATCDPFVSCPAGSFQNWTGTLHSVGWSTTKKMLNGSSIWLLRASQ
jgi:hypothetical protein